VDRQRGQRLLPGHDSRVRIARRPLERAGDLRLHVGRGVLRLRQVPQCPFTMLRCCFFALPTGCCLCYCHVTASTQLVTATYTTTAVPSDYLQTAKCFSLGPPGGALNVRTVCAPQTFTSTSGGFAVIRNYTVRHLNVLD